MDFDGAYKEALCNPELMASLIDFATKGELTVSKLHYLQQESILEKGGHRHNDLIVEIEDETRSTFMIEIQSSPDKTMYARMLEYTYEYHRRCLQQEGCIFPTCSIVYYIGGERWTAPTQYKFVKPNACTPSMNFKYELLDVQHICPDDGMMIPTSAFGIFMMLTGHLKFTEVYRRLKEVESNNPTLLSPSLRKTFIKFITRLNADKPLADVLISFLRGDITMANNLWKRTVEDEVTDAIKNAEERIRLEESRRLQREMVLKLRNKVTSADLAAATGLTEEEVQFIIDQGA